MAAPALNAELVTVMVEAGACPVVAAVVAPPPPSPEDEQAASKPPMPPGPRIATRNGGLACAGVSTSLTSYRGRAGAASCARARAGGYSRAHGRLDARVPVESPPDRGERCARSRLCPASRAAPGSTT